MCRPGASELAWSLPGLEKIYLDSNLITDLTPLENLRGKRDFARRPAVWGFLKPNVVKELSLQKNKITDLQPLAGFTELQWLNLAENKCSDLRPLARMQKLARLDLQGNQIHSLDGLGQKPRLTTLNWSNNNASNLEGAPLELYGSLSMALVGWP